MICCTPTVALILHNKHKSSVMSIYCPSIEPLLMKMLGVLPIYVYQKILLIPLTVNKE